MTISRASLIVVALGCSVAAGISAAAFPEQPIGSAVSWYYQQGFGRTSLLSPPFPAWPSGRSPNWADGSSDDVAFSQDNRTARLVAFDSDASSLGGGPGTSARQVYVVKRNPGNGDLGGNIELASVGPTGEPGNGASVDPSLDGSTRERPHCVAFASSATNLDPRATTPASRIYVRDLRARRTALASGSIREASHPVIDGFCRELMFSASGRVWLTRVGSSRVVAVADGTDADLQTNGRGVAYVARGQIWYRPIAQSGAAGRARLVSADPHGRQGDGPSTSPALDDVGNYVVFASAATNLCAHVCRGVSADANGNTVDIFRRTLTHNAPTHDRMQMVSFDYKRRLQLNGPSSNPQISAAGENVIFETTATNVRRGNAAYSVENPSPAVMTWSFPRGRGYGNVTMVTRPGCYELCFAPETNPAMSSRGNYVGYTSPMQEFCVDGRPRFAGDRDCPQTTDVFIHFMGPGPEPFPRGG